VGGASGCITLAKYYNWYDKFLKLINQAEYLQKQPLFAAITLS